MTDLNKWVEKLEQLQKCNLNPNSCTHDEDENGKLHAFDYASIDMVLDQIISEMKQTLQEQAKVRLEYLRKELQEERISYSELAELQTLAKYIDKNDVFLLEAAGVPEFS